MVKYRTGAGWLVRALTILTSATLLAANATFTVPSAPVAATASAFPVFYAVLNGGSLLLSQPGAPSGSGFAFMEVDAASGQVCYQVESDGLGQVTRASLLDYTDTLVADFALPPLDGTPNKDCVTISPSTAASIVASPGDYSVVFYTNTYPWGAAAGSLYTSTTNPCSVRTATWQAPIGAIDYLYLQLGLKVARFVGTGFPPNVTLKADLTYGGGSPTTQVAATDANGDVVIYHAFAAGDEGLWTMTLTDPNNLTCHGSAQVAVSPIYFGVRTQLCPSSIQTPSQLLAVGASACGRLVLLPADYSDPPTGYTADWVSGTFDNVVIPKDGMTWHTTDAYPDGGGTCDPTTHVCDGAWSYRLDWTPAGPTSVSQALAPSGYRIGYALAYSNGQLIPSTFSTDHVLQFDSTGYAGGAVAVMYEFAGPFTDIGGSIFVNDILWLYDAGITTGCSATTFCPDAPVTRGQMAAFLDRALSLPTTSTDYFTDDEGSLFETDINRLAAAGITTGCSATTYCPDADVTRGQMAAYLDRALSLPTTSTDYFTDDEGSLFETDINRLAAAGITTGCSPTTYCPNEYVTRGQMAAFLHRAFGP